MVVVVVVVSKDCVAFPDWMYRIRSDLLYVTFEVIIKVGSIHTTFEVDQSSAKIVKAGGVSLCCKPSLDK